MTSIIKVDQIQTASGSTPTADSLGVNVTTTSMPTGSVLQVKQTNIADGAVSFSGDVSDIISLSITPQFSNSKILFTATTKFERITTANAYYYANMGRTISGGSAVFLTRNQNAAGYEEERYVRLDGTNSYLDSPNTTNSITYGVSIDQAGDAGTFNGKECSITLMEIAG
tara:strand:+ start:3291 stop:3800 length:510 start_codon:yes stop_codon:yes gene_type:complete